MWKRKLYVWKNFCLKILGWIDFLIGKSFILYLLLYIFYHKTENAHIINVSTYNENSHLIKQNCFLPVLWQLTKSNVDIYPLRNISRTNTNGECSLTS